MILALRSSHVPSPRRCADEVEVDVVIEHPYDDLGIEDLWYMFESVLLARGFTRTSIENFFKNKAKEYEDE